AISTTSTRVPCGRSPKTGACAGRPPSAPELPAPRVAHAERFGDRNAAAVRVIAEADTRTRRRVAGEPAPLVGHADRVLRHDEARRLLLVLGVAERTLRRGAARRPAARPRPRTGRRRLRRAPGVARRRGLAHRHHPAARPGARARDRRRVRARGARTLTRAT